MKLQHVSCLVVLLVCGVANTASRPTNNNMPEYIQKVQHLVNTYKERTNEVRRKSHLFCFGQGTFIDENHPTLRVALDNNIKVVMSYEINQVLRGLLGEIKAKDLDENDKKTKAAWEVMTAAYSVGKRVGLAATTIVSRTKMSNEQIVERFDKANGDILQFMETLLWDHRPPGVVGIKRVKNGNNVANAYQPTGEGHH